MKSRKLGEISGGGGGGSRILGKKERIGGKT